MQNLISALLTAHAECIHVGSRLAFLIRAKLFGDPARKVPLFTEVAVRLTPWESFAHLPGLQAAC